MVPVDGLVHGVDELGPALAGLALALVGVAQGDPGPAGQQLDGGHEVEVLDLPDERDGVAPDLAAPAPVEAELLVHVERRRLLGVERAQARPSACPTRRSWVYWVITDDDVGRGPHGHDVLVDDAHGPGRVAASCDGPRPDLAASRRTRPRVERDRGGVERGSSEVRHRHRLAGLGQAEARRPAASAASPGPTPSAARSARVTAPWRLARRSPSGPSTSGTWAQVGRGQPEQVGEVGLPGRGGQEVVAAHHLLDALVGVVHHHGEVVGGHAVVAAQHEVVDHRGDLAVEPVDDRHHLARPPAAAAPAGRPSASSGGSPRRRAGPGRCPGRRRAAGRAARRPPRATSRRVQKQG